MRSSKTRDQLSKPFFRSLVVSAKGPLRSHPWVPRDIQRNCSKSEKISPGTEGLFILKP